jgi:hypothetical protein
MLQYIIRIESNMWCPENEISKMCIDKIDFVYVPDVVTRVI